MTPPTIHPPVQLRPCATERLPEWLARFTDRHVDDLSRLRLAAPDQLRRFTRAMLLAECDDTPAPRHSHFFDIVDVRDDRVVGGLWTSGHNFGFGTTLYLRHLFVDPEFRRRGYARAALRTLAGLGADCHALSGLALAVHDGNHAAESLYRGLGFRPFARLMFLRTLAPGDVQT